MQLGGGRITVALSLILALGACAAVQRGETGASLATAAPATPELRTIEGIEADPALSAAARDLALRAARSGRAAAATAGDGVWEAVGRHGAVVADLRPLVVVATDAATAEARLLERVAAQRGTFNRLGLGSARGEDGTHAWVALLSWVQVDWEIPLPRSLPLGSVQRVEGRLSAPLHSPEVLLLPPSGALQRHRIPQGTDFSLRIAFEEAGRHTVEVMGQGPEGPMVAALVFVEVEADGAPTPPAPRETGEIPRDAEELRAALNRRRTQAGLPALTRNPALERAARDYAEAIAAGAPLRHRGPDGDDVADRVLRQGYRFERVGENLAEAPDLGQAQRSLERSPAHLAQILDPAVSEIGIGVARRPEHSSWIVVQIFAAPAPRAVPNR